MKNLPNKPSALIRVALIDLEKAETNPVFAIDMSVYHTPIKSVSTCCVCFAGCVMATSKESGNGTMHLGPADFCSKTEAKLAALDYFREGLIYSGLSRMGIDCPESMKITHTITSYYTSPIHFKEDMHVLANDLEKRGL